MPEIRPSSTPPSDRCGRRRSRHDRHDADPWLDGHDPVTCPGCEAVAGLRLIELDLRWLSLDLWAAGWSPDEVIDRLRLAVPDPRAVELFTLGVLADDRLRSDQARPHRWRQSVKRLRAATGVADDAAPIGWLPAWIRGCSDHETSHELAMVIGDTIRILSELHDPPAAA